MAKRDPGEGEEEYAHVEIPARYSIRRTLDENSSQLRAGRFIELAFYGVREILRIRVHPEPPWQVARDAADRSADPRGVPQKGGIRI